MSNYINFNAIFVNTRYRFKIIQLIRSKNKWQLAAIAVGILYALTLLVFAADVFSKEQSISQTASDLFLHLLPTVLVLLFVFVGYKWPLIGAIIFLLTGAAYIFTGWSNMHWTAHCLVAGPLFIMSVLYITDWKSKK